MYAYTVHIVCTHAVFSLESTEKRRDALPVFLNLTISASMTHSVQPNGLHFVQVPCFLSIPLWMEIEVVETGSLLKLVVLIAEIELLAFDGCTGSASWDLSVRDLNT